MPDEVLFQITKDLLETGLRGFPVGYCPTSTVEPLKGLFYVGYPIEELAKWEPESVIFLLYHGRKGSPQEVEALTKDLRRRAKVSPELIQHIRSLPRKGHPMKLFNCALLLCGMFEETGDYREDCLNFIAKIPEIAATVINHHAGWKGAASDPSRGYMENFTAMLGVPHANQEHLNRAMKLFNVLHYDHGGGNLSTFVGKAVASGLEGMYGSMAAAMCALAGPKHGRANQDCLEFVQEIRKALGDDPTEQELEDFLRQRLDAGGLVFGFGHAVLRVEDPRATVLYAVAARHFPNDPLVKITKLLRTTGAKVLKENPKIADPCPNVDAISGTVLAASGFCYPEYFTILFGLSRVVGIAIQVVYERCEARGGKGTPIVRPKYLYKPRDVDNETKA